MQYRTLRNTNDKLSVLGYGCMRFPRKNGIIDETKTKEQIEYAIEKGINYFDTAYIYPDSEKVLGNILCEGLREKVKIASKMPITLTKKYEDFINIFEIQLKRLKTNYLDYYLIHNLNAFSEFDALVKMGILDFFKDEQEKGRIINVGFSFHGNFLEFQKIVDSNKWDFCQIQFNYLDENFQAGLAGLEYAYEKGLDIIIMEPLRGGTLVNKLPKKASEMIEKTNKTPAYWALKWILNHKEVSLLLSGMNDISQINENIKIAEESFVNSMSEGEINFVNNLKKEFDFKVGCTGCGYCMPCPHGVDIPFCFSMYNSKMISKEMFPAFLYLTSTKRENKPLSRASQCKKCGKCEKHCPQNLPIISHLSEVSKELEKPFYKIVAYLYRQFQSKKK